MSSARILEFIFDARTAPAEYDIDKLFKIEQPKWQLQISRIDDVSLVAKAASVFVVSVEQENAQIRPRLEDLLDQYGDAAGFSNARRAEHGKMPAQHLVDLDTSAECRLLLQAADDDILCAGPAENKLQRVGADRDYRIPDQRIFSHAAPKPDAALFFSDLAHELEAS